MQLVGSIDISPADFLRSVGEVFAVFDGPTHDSGNVSYGVSVEGRRYFVKTAGREDRRGERVAVLRNAVALARSCEHPCLPQLHDVIESPNGPMLVYEWCSGDLVRGALQRFRSLPAPEIERVLDAIFDLHRALVRAGWIASDFYDGSLLYDLTTGAFHVIDLDHYQRGSFHNTDGRMLGSARFMAPEEHELGAIIDERTTVFTLGRTVEVLLPDPSSSQLAVVLRATMAARERRYSTVDDFSAAWQAAHAII